MYVKHIAWLLSQHCGKHSNAQVRMVGRRETSVLQFVIILQTAFAKETGKGLGYCCISRSGAVDWIGI